MIYVLSGGGGLNLKVVGGTIQPTSPKENTIWVNTDTAIHNYAFSATQPYRVSKNKNLIVYPYRTSTFSQNGVNYTINSDGSVTANGTATTEQSRVDLLMWNEPETGIELEPGKYFLSGCPANGGSDAYNLQFVVTYDNGATFTWINDYGNGVALNITAPAKVRIGIRVAPNKQVSNLVFKPQLEKGSAATSFVKGDATGMVWIKTGAASPAAMNVDKKHTVMVYPLSGGQYLNGIWADKLTKSYQNGEWVEWWDGQFLGDGNQYEYITGGWEAVAWQEGPQSYNAKTPSLSFGSTGTTVTFQSESGGVFINKAKVDLSNYNTLKVRLDFKTALDGNIHLQVRTNNYTEQSYWRVNSTGILASYDLVSGHAAADGVVWTLDISDVSAPCYILIGQEAYSQTKIVIHDIWAE